MEAKMGFTNWANSKVKKINWTDVAIVKFSSIAFGVMIAALIPSLIEINVWWIAVVSILLAIKPVYKAFSK